MCMSDCFSHSNSVTMTKKTNVEAKNTSSMVHSNVIINANYSSP